MTAVATSQEAVKRRQAVQVSLFLIAVALGTAGIFYAVRADLVAYRRGVRALARADFATASVQLQEAWAHGYQTPRVRLALAHALVAAGRPTDALPFYLAALAEAPRDESLLETVAGIYQTSGQPEKGLGLYARLGAPAQLSVRALARLGDLQQQAGLYDAAVATYRLAADRAPREPELQLRVGMVLAWTGHHAEAAEALRSAVALDPNRRLARLYLARVLLWGGRFDEAVTEYRRVLPP